MARVRPGRSQPLAAPVSAPNSDDGQPSFKVLTVASAKQRHGLDLLEQISP